MAFLHRPEEGFPLSKVADEFQKTYPNRLALLMSGEKPSTNQPFQYGFLLIGSEDEVARVSPRVLELLEAKGGGKKGRFQGKVLFVFLR